MNPQPSWPEPEECSEFYRGYIEEVRGPLLDALERDERRWRGLVLTDRAARRAGRRYAPGKWSLREVVGHVTDAERMFVSRALAFARGDRAAYPGFDENEYAAASGADRRELVDLVEELSAVRRATILMLKGFGDEVWDRRGVASGRSFTVRSCAWIIGGHSCHHRRIVRERYLP